MNCRPLIIAIVALVLSGCAGQKGFNRGEMISSVRSDNPAFVSSGLTVEQIEKLKPQVQLPIILAVAPPIKSYSRYGSEVLTWSPEEMAELESWAMPLQKAGVIRDLIVLPSNFLEHCQPNDPGCRLNLSRSAAARVQADALLQINVVTATDEYSNPLSVFNLTIVGMWLIPGHHRDALTIVEGAMIDNRNEYLYAFARGEAEERIIRPYMYADSWKVVRRSRLGALQSFGREFIKQAEQLKTK